MNKNVLFIICIIVKVKTKKVSSHKLLEYVCWISDAEKAYEVALSTYDLDLVALVAQFT